MHFFEGVVVKGKRKNNIKVFRFSWNCNSENEKYIILVLLPL